MNKNDRQDPAGFSLIEVMFALTLAGLVVAALAVCFLQTTNIQQQLTGRITAMVIGQGKLAELECESESGMSGVFSAPHHNYQWLATEEAAGATKKITLIVKWSDKNAAFHQTTFMGYRNSK